MSNNEKVIHLWNEGQVSKHFNYNDNVLTL